MGVGKKHHKKHRNRARNKGNRVKELLQPNFYQCQSHYDRQVCYPELMAERHGAVIVRCPACGRLSRVPRTSRKRWKCPCTPKHSRFVHEDLLKDQKNIVLERAGTDSDGSGFPRLAYCNMLERVTIKGYDTIPEAAFWGCKRLQSVQLGNDVAAIKSNAFARCSRLQSVQLGDHVAIIGVSAFQDCPALKEINLPDSLIHICEYAFAESGLRRITLPESLQQVEEYAFMYCSDLTDVEIPEKLRSGMQPNRVFDVTPFYRSHYQGLPVGSVELWYISLQEFMKTAPLQSRPVSLICHGQDDLRLSASADETERKQMDESFQKLVSLELRSEKPIPPWRFRGCSNLKRLILPYGLRQIGEGAFAHCTALKEVIVPDTVTAIGPQAFFGCTALRRVQLPDALAHTLDDSVFAGTPFWENKELRERANRHSETLVVSLGSGAGKAAQRFAWSTRSRQDLLFLNSVPHRLDDHFSDCADLVLSMPETPFGKPRIHTVQLGKKLLRDRDTDNDPALGAQALQEAETEIRALLKHYRFVIVIACLGGGTGGSVPVLAGWLREMGIPYTVIASLPFAFEGKCSYAEAQKALDAMQDSPVTVVPYESMKEQYEKEGVKITMLNAFETADREIGRHIQCILAERGLAVIE